MISLEDIENKQKELEDTIKSYKKEIEEMKWRFINEEYGLSKGCVCNINSKYCVLIEVGSFGKYIQSVHFSVIKKDGTIGKNSTCGFVGSVKKEFDTYEEYRKSLEGL